MAEKLNIRQEKLLNIIITEYTRTAQPIGSKFIANCGNFDLSPATIRNEMGELEDMGFIFAPHTSAGRIPTEKGYQFFVKNYLKDKDLNKRQQEALLKSIKEFKSFNPDLMKEIAKSIAELSSEAVFIGFSPSSFYYTGISNLFSQPEFVNQHNLVCNLSSVIDHLDEIINKIYYDFQDEVAILIGTNNPFGTDCSTILTGYKTKNQQGVMGILGPIRMDYQNNFSLMKFSKHLISNLK